MMLTPTPEQEDLKRLSREVRVIFARLYHSRDYAHAPAAYEYDPYPFSQSPSNRRLFVFVDFADMFASEEHME